MMKAVPPYRTVLLPALVLAALTGCRTFSPTPLEQVPFRERA
jgi:hypothetical protein